MPHAEFIEPPVRSCPVPAPLFRLEKAGEDIVALTSRESEEDPASGVRVVGLAGSLLRVIRCPNHRRCQQAPPQARQTETGGWVRTAEIQNASVLGLKLHLPPDRLECAGPPLGAHTVAASLPRHVREVVEAGHHHDVVVRAVEVRAATHPSA